ncbi:MAG: NAD-dependent malic enzyme [Chloroflexi bacterium]|nr:NAD-dependent malic enzyme [Chloroflexota bacterium]
MRPQPSASYSLTIRITYPNHPGMLGQVTTAIGEEGGDIGAVDLIGVQGGIITRDITVACRDEAHGDAIVRRLSAVPGVHVRAVSDRTFLVHLGGKIEVVPKTPVKTRDDLSMVYTPGVARVCTAIAADPAKAWALTIKKNTVAVVSDGTAVLGLGDIGPLAAAPVMEGKAMIFKAFAGVDAFPICLATKDPDEIVATVQRIAPIFGGINLEDIAAPKCFDIEERLRHSLDIPVMHDDQHGTAVVVLAALKNALKVVGKSLASAKIVINGSGASGMATAKILALAGAQQLILCDTAGAIYRGREVNMNRYKEAIARTTNPNGERGTLREVLRGADVFIGLSAPGVVTPDDIRAMAPDPVVFAMANPIPEVMPELIQGIARVIATGRSDYPNQINNSLGFPGIFRGALDVHAMDINEAMKLAAADAIASLVSDDELSEEYIVPSMFDRRVVEAVAEATRTAAIATGVARKVPH